MSIGERTEPKTVGDHVLQSLDWRLIGPHRGGRVVAVAGDVSDRRRYYFGACAGGVWKTEDAGITWRNVSDGYFTTAAIGALAVSTKDPNVIYAGTGETSIRNQVSHGDGVYKSVDGGRTWENVGLRDTRYIGRILIHPDNPDRVYVAALGHAFGPNDERGVFRTTDGGQTWERIFHKSPRAGSHDITMDLNNPRILYTVSWQVQRYPHTLDSGGPESGLYRSFDGGDTWEEITRKPGLPQGILGKIGVAASPARPGRVWALIEAEDGALFRSDDYGETWIRLSEQSTLRTRPWYYMHVTADPQDEDVVYVQNYRLWKSIDGGANFKRIPTPHGDDHALWINPNDNQNMIEGNDGGAMVTFNGGKTWSSIYNQPTAQFYHVTTDDQFPYRVYGSQQDNTTLSVPSATTEVAIHEHTWFIPGGGESGYVAIKPDEPWHIVASGPAGRHIYNDIMTHYDHRTGQVRNITVWPELYGWGVGAEVYKYRFQWTFPILFSKHAPHELYVASNYVHKSTDLGNSFEVISPDLTRNDPDKLKASGGPITRDNTGAEVYCVIFALAESPHRKGVFWAGTDDGLIHITEDDGKTWRNITPPDLPEWTKISIIDPSPHEDGVAYVAAHRYMLDDTKPYLYKTTDYGQTWTKITNGIPDGEFTRVIREDPNRRGLLYAGTETGIYVSFNDGESWQRMGGNLPVVPIYDFVIKNTDLVVATHGRSFWILDDLTQLYQLHDEIQTTDAFLFKPKSRERLRIVKGLGGEGEKGFTNYAHAGSSQFLYEVVDDENGKPEMRPLTAGENLPVGITLQYYLREQPAEGVTVTILDSEGNEIRAFNDAPARSGINRFVWNFRYPGVEDPKSPDLQPTPRPDGPMVLPGTYQVRLTVGDKTLTQEFEVLRDPRLSVSDEDLRAQRDMLLELLDALNQTNRSVDNVDALIAQATAWRARTDDAEIVGLVDQIEAKLREVRSRLIDVNMRQSQLWPSGLHEKFGALLSSVDGADYAPPQQARDVFAELCEQLKQAKADIEQVQATEIAALNAAIGKAGLSPVGL